MHSTIHQSPTAYQQIKRILILLACAALCGIAVICLMLYTAKAERRYVLADVLIAPELLPRIALHEQSFGHSDSNVWRFDSIDLKFIDPITHQLTSRTLTQNQYARLYAELGFDASLSEAGNTPAKQSMELTIWLKTDRSPERRLMQSILFFPELEAYRVRLYQLNPSSEHEWATYHHEGLSTLLHALTQESL